MSRNAKHIFVMIVCCLIPLAMLLAFTVFRVPLNALMIMAFPLLCLSAHLLMIRKMGREPHVSEPFDRTAHRR
jgi:hypothetical protein